MSHRRRCFWSYRNIIPIILASIGLGMVLAIILPFWLWIIGAGAALIIYAWYCYSNK